MKTMKILKSVCAAVMVAGAMCGMSACDWEESHGQLDGFWHLQAVDTLATGGQCQLEEPTVFWSVEGKVLETRILPFKILFFRYDHQGDELRLYAPMGTKDPTVTDADYPITDETRLYEFGVHGLDTRFRILQLTSQRLVLQDDTLRLHFERY